jgi:hypothetical protein
LQSSYLHAKSPDLPKCVVVAEARERSLTVSPLFLPILAVSLLSFLHLRLIDASLTKLRRPLGEPLPALGLLFGRRGGIDNPFDRFRGEFPSARPAARFADRLRSRFDLEPDLD